jgi:threonine dehydrogenase-like Zn-dependent dehydrogenase
MKALHITAPEKAEIIDLPMPPAPGPNQVVIKIQATSLCNQKEWRFFHNIHPPQRGYDYPAPPGFPGQEGTGEVVETGARVNSLEKGDRVVVCGWAGNLHQEYVTTEERWALKITRDKSWDSLAPADLMARMLALIRRGEKIFRANAVVLGLGPSGLAAVLWLKLLGARKITGIDPHPDRRNLGRELGLDEDLSSGDLKSLEMLAMSRPETVIECSGTPAGIYTALDMAAKEALLFGPPEESLSLDISVWMDKNLAIKAQSTFDWPIWEETAACLNRGLIDPGRMITHSFPFSLDSYLEAQDLIEKQKAVKVIFTFSGKE